MKKFKIFLRTIQDLIKARSSNAKTNLRKMPQVNTQAKLKERTNQIRIKRYQKLEKKIKMQKERHQLVYHRLPEATRLTFSIQKATFEEKMRISFNHGVILRGTFQNSSTN